MKLRKTAMLLAAATMMLPIGMLANPASAAVTQPGKCTKLTITEQGVFLDGYDDAGARERGTNDLMDKLGRSLQA